MDKIGLLFSASPYHFVWSLMKFLSVELQLLFSYYSDFRFCRVQIFLEMHISHYSRIDYVSKFISDDFLTTEASSFFFSVFHASLQVRLNALAHTVSNYNPLFEIHYNFKHYNLDQGSPTTRLQTLDGTGLWPVKTEPHSRR